MAHESWHDIVDSRRVDSSRLESTRRVEWLEIYEYLEDLDEVLTSLSLLVVENMS